MDNFLLQLSGSSSSPCSSGGSCQRIPLLATPVGVTSSPAIASCSPNTAKTSPPAAAATTASVAAASPSHLVSAKATAALSTSQILTGVVAFVDVRTEADNRSRAIESILRQLGAQVSDKLSNDVTHVVFKDGKKRTRDVAIRRQLHFVSVLWLVRCKETGVRADEKDFPVVQQLQTTPLPYGRLKRFRSMQPKSFDEMEADSEKKIQRRQKARQRKVLLTPSSPRQLPFCARFLVENTQKRFGLDLESGVDCTACSDSDGDKSDSSLTVPDTPPSLRQRLLGKPRNNVTMATDNAIQCKLFDGGNSPTHVVEDSQPIVNGACDVWLSSKSVERRSGTTPVKNSSTFPAMTRLSTPTPARDITPLPAVAQPSTETHVKDNAVFTSLVRLSTASPAKDSSSLPSVSNVSIASPSRDCAARSLSVSRVQGPSSVSELLTVNARNSVSPEISVVPSSGRLVLPRFVSSPTNNVHDAVNGKNAAAPNRKSLGHAGRRSTTSRPSTTKRCSSPSLADDDVAPNAKKLKLSVAGSAPVSKLSRNIKLIPLSEVTASQAAKTNHNDREKEETELDAEVGQLTGSGVSAGLISRGDTSRRESRSSPTMSQETAQQSSVSRTASNYRRSISNNIKHRTGNSNNSDSSGSIELNSEKQSLKVGFNEGPVTLTRRTISGKQNNVTPESSAVPPALCIDSLVLETRVVKRRRSNRASGLASLSTLCADSADESLGENDSQSQLAGVRRSFVSDACTPRLPRLPAAWERLGKKHTSERCPDEVNECDNKMKKNRKSVCSPPSRPSLSGKSEQVNNNNAARTELQEKIGNTATAVVEKKGQSLTLDGKQQRRSGGKNGKGLERRSAGGVAECPKRRSGSAVSRGHEQNSAADKDKQQELGSEVGVTNGVVRGQRQRSSGSGVVKGLDRRSAGKVASDTVVAKQQEKICGDGVIVKIQQENGDCRKKLKSRKQLSVKDVDKQEVKSSPSNKRRRTSSQSTSVGDTSCTDKQLARLKNKTITVSMTSLHTDEQLLVRNTVKRLGVFSLSEQVLDSTTHVVCGGNRRTVKVLMGIARGCWIVSVDWVKQSAAAAHWVDEADYEQSDIFPASKVSRLERSEAGESYRQNLFSSIGPIVVAETTAPPRQELKQLIVLCGGQVTTCVRKNHICVGQFSKKADASVSEQWVLDSITKHKTLRLQDYQLTAE